MRGKFNRTIVAANSGAVVPYAMVDVFDQVTGNRADIYSSQSGGAPLSNPFETTDLGFASFFIDAGQYRFVARSAGGAFISEVTHEIVVDPIMASGIYDIIEKTGANENIDYRGISLRYLQMTNAAAKTLTFRPFSTFEIQVGEVFNVRNIGAGLLTIIAGSGVTISPPASGILTIEQNGTASIICTAEDEYDMITVDMSSVDTSIQKVETFAALATTPAPTAGMVVYTKELSSGINGGHFIDTAGTITEDGYSLINNTVTTGRHWKRAADDARYKTTSIAKTLDWSTVNNDVRLQLVKKRMLDGLAVNIVCVGDSITADTYPAELQVYLRDYYQNPNILVLNSGTSGFRSDQMLADWSTRVTAKNPHIVIMMAGMNDTIQDYGIQALSDNMSEMLRLCYIAGYASILCNVTPHVANAIAGMNRSHEYKDSLQIVASKYGVRFIDMDKHVRDLYEGSGGMSQVYIAADGVHYTAGFGYKNLAGVIFAYGVCGGDIVVNKFSKFGTTNAKLIIDSNVTKSVASAYSIDFEPVRLLPTTFSGAATLYMYLDSHEQCDLVICASREYYNGKDPKCGVLNTEIVGSAIEYFALGVNSASPTSRSIAVPFNACKLKPGLNVIKLFANDTGTMELFNFQVVPCVEDYNKFVEAASNTPANYSENHDTNTGIRRYVSAEKSIASTKRARIFTMKNRYRDSSASRAYAFRVRALLASGVIWHIGQVQNFTREWRESMTITMTQNAGNIDVVVQMLDIFGTATTVATNSLAGTIAADNRFDIVQTNALFGIYLNGSGTALISLPFCVGVFDLEITSPSDSACYINPVAELDPSAAALAVSTDGEAWVTYGATKKVWRTIGGVNVGAVLS